MKGLIKMTHAASTDAAWKDWERLEQAAFLLEFDEWADEYRPNEQAGHKTIDRCIKALREKMGFNSVQDAVDAANKYIDPDDMFPEEHIK